MVLIDFIHPVDVGVNVWVQSAGGLFYLVLRIEVGKPHVLAGLIIQLHIAYPVQHFGLFGKTGDTGFCL